MFDIGFSELVLIFTIGLVVLGPQRLPVAIRTVVSWIRTLRNLANNVQTELAQELKLQELQENIKKAEHLNLSTLSPELSKTVEELKASAAKMQQQLEQQAQVAHQAADQFTSSVNTSSAEVSAAVANTDILPDEQAELAEIDEEKLILEQHDDDLATYDPMTIAEPANITNKEKKES
ncbi:Sec-independent protein translocase protein TatB [Gallibacterium trehalosifermentans]|uniref:Sec-independent protein translocase protein TatB n=1 Tax=Gallibacterium trehalosifermentans TaxID=516935 RepID=A0ABV6GXM7_9PAST